MDTVQRDPTGILSGHTRLLPLFYEIFQQDFLAPTINTGVQKLLQRSRRCGGTPVPEVLDLKFWEEYENPYE